MCLGANLYVYKGDWGLPTIDFECLRAMCLVQFTRCPIQINANGNPFWSGAGKLPYLQVGDKKFVGYGKIKSFLDEEGYPVDKHLNVKTKHLSQAYADWVFSNLHCYYHYFVFGEPNNFEHSRAFYAKRTPFPFSFYYPAQYQKEAHDVVLTMGGFDLQDNIEKHESAYLTLKAKKCVNILCRKLGKKVWFFGDVFSEFDAIVYSYLAILYKITLPNNPIQNHIKGCPNLVNFINRISKDIFKSESITSVKKIRASTGSEKMLTPAEHKTKLLAGIGAFVAMGAFAAWRGLHQQFSNSSSYDFIDGDDADDVEGEMD